MTDRRPAICILGAVLILAQLVSATCPETCSCQVDRLNCRNMSLQLVPSGVNTNATLLDFSFNKISVIDKHAFSYAKEVEILFLNHNEIKEVQPYCFNINKNLTHLYLSYNKISKLDVDIFKFQTNLKYLLLKNNILKFLDAQIFRNTVNLVILDLSENKIKYLNPNIFEKNSVLSWVGLKYNPLPFSIQWKKLFSNSLNVIDFEFCKGHNESVVELRAIQSMNKNKTRSRNSLTLEEFTSLEIRGMSHSEVSQLKYKLFRELYDLEYPLISELVLAEDRDVLTLSGETILCYCEQVSAWFWCHDSSSSCHVTKREKYKMLNCSDQNSDMIEFKENIEEGDSDDKKNRFQNFIYRTVSGKTLRNTLLYGAIPGCLVIMVIAAFVVKKIRRRKLDEESEREQRYSALRHSFHNPSEDRPLSEAR